MLINQTNELPGAVGKRMSFPDSSRQIFVEYSRAADFWLKRSADNESAKRGMTGHIYIDNIYKSIYNIKLIY